MIKIIVQGSKACLRQVYSYTIGGWGETSPPTQKSISACRNHAFCNREEFRRAQISILIPKKYLSSQLLDCLRPKTEMFSPKLPTKSIQDGTGSQFCWHKVPFQHHIGIQEAILCGLGTCWSVEPCGRSENEAADHALIGNDLPLWKALPNLFGLWSF